MSGGIIATFTSCVFAAAVPLRPLILAAGFGLTLPPELPSAAQGTFSHLSAH
jgi:hypothetical protein